MSFYRIDLKGERILLSDNEIYDIRKDILTYYDVNAGEPINTYMPYNQFELKYWEYISIGSDNKFTESEDYTNFIEEGCLALLNGIAFELLYEPVGNIEKEWNGTDVSIIIQYLESYAPSDKKLATAKRYLIDCFYFILNMTYENLDEDAYIKDFDFYYIGEWFDENIVQNYYFTKSEILAPKDNIMFEKKEKHMLIIIIELFLLTLILFT